MKRPTIKWLLWGRWHGIAIRRCARIFFSYLYSIILKICKQTMTVYLLFSVSSRSVCCCFCFGFISIISSLIFTKFHTTVIRTFIWICTAFLCICLFISFPFCLFALVLMCFLFSRAPQDILHAKKGNCLYTLMQCSV